MTGILLKATVLLLAACVAALALRRSTASARCLVWVAAIAGLLAIPVASVVLPPLRVTAPAQVILPPDGVERALARNGGTLAAAATGVSPSYAEAYSASWILLLWISGAAVVLGRWVAGVVHVRALARSARPFECAALPELCEAVGTGRVRVLAGERVLAPMAAGIFRHVILLPASARDWTADQLRLVLAHELFHHRRRDPLTQALAQLVCAFYWPHPLAWLAAARLRREREQACDDAVLRLGARASEYAQVLVDLARSLRGAQPGWAAAGVAMSHVSNLERRIQAMLDPQRIRHGLSRGHAAAAAVLAVLVIVPLAVLHLSGQATSRLSGAIRDPSGAVVPNATVSLSTGTPPGTRPVIATTKANGEYSFDSLAEGTWRIDVTQPGFKRFSSNVVLRAGMPARLDVVLEIGSVAETIDVVAHSPVPAASGPRRIPVGGNVQATKLMRMVRPEYPEEARAAGVEGTVLIQAVISTAGNLLSAHVLNMQVHPALEKAALDAIQQWQYQPTLLNGVPVEVVTTITVNFRLSE